MPMEKQATLLDPSNSLSVPARRAWKRGHGKSVEDCVPTSGPFFLLWIEFCQTTRAEKILFGDSTRTMGRDNCLQGREAEIFRLHPFDYQYVLELTVI